MDQKKQQHELIRGEQPVMESRHFFEAEAGPRQNCRSDAEAVKAGNEARLGPKQSPRGRGNAD